MIPGLARSGTDSDRSSYSVRSIADLISLVPAFFRGTNPRATNNVWQHIRLHVHFNGVVPQDAQVLGYLDTWTAEVLWALIVFDRRNVPRVGPDPMDRDAAVDWVSGVPGHLADGWIIGS